MEGSMNKNQNTSQILEKDLESVKKFLLKHPDPKVRAVAESKYNQQQLGTKLKYRL